MTHGNRPLARLQSLLNDILTILPQPSSEADTEPMVKDLSDFLERQARHFGVEKVNQDPVGAADSSVEAKGARWCHALHHGEKGRRDDDVGTPAGTTYMYQLQPFIRRVGEFEVTDQVRNIVPIGRTSMGKKSVDIHAVLPTDTP